MGLGSYGVASHTTVDGPFHAPGGVLEEWAGFSSTPILKTITHLINDVFPSPSTIAIAYRANVDLLNGVSTQSQGFNQVNTFGQGSTPYK